MANFNFDNVTLSAKEVAELSKVIFEVAFTNPELQKMHSIEEGIDMKTQILLLSAMGMQGLPAEGCEAQDSDAGIVATQKYWENNKVEVRIPYCNTDLPALLKAFGQKSNKYDVEASDEVKMLASRLLEAIDETVLRLVWFGDKDAENIVSGGTITNTVNKNYFKSVDGLWKQIFAGVTAGDIKRATIAANTGATYSAQELSTGEALTVMRKVYNQSDSRLKNHPDAQFIVTQSMYDNFLDKLEDAGLNAVGQLAINDGVMTYRGRKIVVSDFMDRIITSSLNNGTKYNYPNRVVFSTPDNLRVGTLDSGEFKELSIWYDKTDRKVYTENIFSLDAKVLEGYLISVGY
ncbi:hypothetical protein [Flavobacterium capsici]|uniref:Uncharacterized protein n=1 Tax=Flavobacterium capsici TaxID=3075618 RepID=A0AA96F4P7_9FLAO|nr:MULTISPECIES: hypothetical protein [unclassified Flavobacterium]WNM18609.1 hypothetical protein RN608_11385 [Flavobacterium sp. PMR2A8]WNM22660.1 hypothetical protein RN605_04685 [Flavobacterium sp. PMTSA4]